MSVAPSVPTTSYGPMRWGEVGSALAYQRGVEHRSGRFPGAFNDTRAADELVDAGESVAPARRRKQKTVEHPDEESRREARQFKPAALTEEHERQGHQERRRLKQERSDERSYQTGTLTVASCHPKTTDSLANRRTPVTFQYAVVGQPHEHQNRPPDPLLSERHPSRHGVHVHGCRMARSGWQRR